LLVYLRSFVLLVGCVRLVFVPFRCLPLARCSDALRYFTAVLRLRLFAFVDVGSCFWLVLVELRSRLRFYLRFLRFVVAFLVWVLRFLRLVTTVAFCGYVHGLWFVVHVHGCTPLRLFIRLVATFLTFTCSPTFRWFTVLRVQFVVVVLRCGLPSPHLVVVHGLVTVVTVYGFRFQVVIRSFPRFSVPFFVRVRFVRLRLVRCLLRVHFAFGLRTAFGYWLLFMVVTFVRSLRLRLLFHGYRLVSRSVPAVVRLLTFWLCVCSVSFRFGSVPAFPAAVSTPGCSGFTVLVTLRLRCWF
jgi:hypothetical protein